MNQKVQDHLSLYIILTNKIIFKEREREIDRDGEREKENEVNYTVVQNFQLAEEKLE